MLCLVLLEVFSHTFCLGQGIPEGFSQKAKLAYLHTQNKFSNQVNNSEGQGRVADSQKARMYQHQPKIMRAGEDMNYGNLQSFGMNQENMAHGAQGSDRNNMMYTPSNVNSYQMNDRGK